jgi:hypothetical protein
MSEQEKNMERMATDDSGVKGPNADNSPPWLNSTEAVSAIVRQFAADLIRRYGQSSHKDLMAWLTNECFRMNELFIGAGLDTTPYSRGPWNTPDHLGHHLALALHIDGELRLAVRDAFMIFASKIGELMRQHQTEDSFPALQKALDTAVAEFANQLLGLDGAA